MTRSLITENEYAAEAARHIEWLNWMFGITLFLFAISALQFKSPWKVCLVGLLLVIPMYVHAFRSFPPSMVSLRQLAKDEPQNVEIKELVAHLERKYHSWKAAIELSPLWIAFAFYVAVMATGLEGFSFLQPALSWFQA